MMRFHRISPCPKCGGKVKVKWERDGAECVRRRNGYQSRRAKARRDAARVLLNKWLDKQMEVDDELA